MKYPSADSWIVTLADAAFWVSVLALATSIGALTFSLTGAGFVRQRQLEVEQKSNLKRALLETGAEYFVKGGQLVTRAQVALNWFTNNRETGESWSMIPQLVNEFHLKSDEMLQQGILLDHYLSSPAARDATGPLTEAGKRVAELAVAVRTEIPARPETALTNLEAAIRALRNLETEYHAYATAVRGLA